MYKMLLSDRQLIVIQKALESYFRVRMGQFSDLADELAFRGFDYANHDDGDFNDRINRRNESQEILDGVYRKLCPIMQGKTDEMMIAEDLWRVIRFTRWNDRPEPKPHDTVDSYPPLIISDEPAAICRKVRE